MDLGTDHMAADHTGLAEVEAHIGLEVEAHIGLAGIVANMAVVVSVVEEAASVQDIAAVMAADIVAVEGTAADNIVQREDFVSAQAAVDTFPEIDNN